MSKLRARLVAVSGLLAVAALAAGCSSGRATATGYSPDAGNRVAGVETMTMTSSTGQAELLVRPPGRLRGLVLFMHGFDSNQNQILNTAGLFPVRDALLRKGYAIVASAAHGNNFGDPASVQDQAAAVSDARARLPQVADVSILAFSMGGLDALLSASTHELPGLRSVALLSPAVDQTSFLGGPFSAQISSAFGNPPDTQVAALVRQSDPLAQPASSYVGYRYHFWHSAGDGTVPSTQSSTMSNYLASAGISAPVSALTGDHGDLSALEPQAIVGLFSATT